MTYARNILCEILLFHSIEFTISFVDLFASNKEGKTGSKDQERHENQEEKEPDSPVESVDL